MDNALEFIKRNWDGFEEYQYLSALKIGDEKLFHSNSYIDTNRFYDRVEKYFKQQLSKNNLWK